jgi:spore maturation protein CgeB
MKVLIAGAGKAPAIEQYFTRHLNEFGVETRLYAAQNMFFDYYKKTILNKIMFKAGLSNIYPKINRLFKQEVEAFRPDIIWVFKGMEIYPASLQWAKDRQIRLVNYNTDNPFLFSGKGSGNQNVTRSIGLYDLHLTYDRNIRERIQKEFRIPCELLPFGFEEREDLYQQCRLQNEECSLCFVGSPDKVRAAFMESIAAELPLVIYGPGWSRYTSHPNIRIKAAVHGDEFWKTLYRYRVQLNIMRLHNPDSHNMRSFEVPGIGGIMLAPATADHQFYFRENEEVFLYNDPRDCIDKARYLLNLSQAEADNIRRNTRARSIESGYSYSGRARQVKKWFEELYEKAGNRPF